MDGRTIATLLVATWVLINLLVITGLPTHWPVRPRWPQPPAAVREDDIHLFKCIPFVKVNEVGRVTVAGCMNLVEAPPLPSALANATCGAGGGRSLACL